MSKDELIKKIYENNDSIKNFSDVLLLDSRVIERSLSITEIDNEVAEAVYSIIKFWNRKDEEDDIPVEKRTPIKVLIDSCGGDLTAAMTIVDAIELSRTPVYTINIGKAYSAGFTIFICGHKRFAYPNSTFLFHEGSASSGWKDAGKFRNFSCFYEKQIDKMKDILFKYTNVTEELYEKVKNDDWWMFSEEALERKICYEIVTKLI